MQGQAVELLIAVEEFKLYIEVFLCRGDYELDASLAGERIEEEQAGNRRLAVGR